MSVELESRTSSLIDAARRRERWAEEEVARLIGSFSRHACGFKHDTAAPELHWEDVAQEASRAFFGVAMTRFRPEGSERSYLYSIVRVTRLQLARAARRRMRREEVSASSRASVDPGPEAILAVDWILRRMDGGCRRLVERVFLEGASTREMAAELEIVESSVRAKLARCLRRARELAS